MDKTPLVGHYNKNYNINQFLFNGFSKNDWIKNLSSSDSAFYTLVKEEVEELYKNTKSFIGYNMTFDDLYVLSVADTIRQFNKNLNKKTSWFESVCGDNVVIYKKVKQRLVNNLRNLFDNKRRGYIGDLRLEIEFDSQSYEDNECIDEDLQKLLQKDSDILKKNIKKLFESFEIDNDELDYLCQKFDFDRDTVLGYNHHEIKIDNEGQSYMVI